MRWRRHEERICEVARLWEYLRLAKHQYHGCWQGLASPALKSPTSHPAPPWLTLRLVISNYCFFFYLSISFWYLRFDIMMKKEWNMFVLFSLSFSLSLLKWNVWFLSLKERLGCGFRELSSQWVPRILEKIGDCRDNGSDDEYWLQISDVIIVPMYPTYKDNNN